MDKEFLSYALFDNDYNCIRIYEFCHINKIVLCYKAIHLVDYV